MINLCRPTFSNLLCLPVACFVSASLILAAGCGENSSASGSSTNDAHADSGHDHPHDDHDHPHPHPHPHGDETGAGQAPGIAIPRAVRDNLGIRFAQAERRAVSETLRVPGQFELLPTALRDYHAPLSGRIELLVDQFDEVEQGTVLARLDSPEWRELQAKLTQAQASIKTAASNVKVAEVSHREQQQLVELLQGRVDRLADASVRQVELEHELAQARLALPRMEAQVRAAEVRLDEARSIFDSHLQLAAAKTGLSLSELAKNEGEHPPLWKTLAKVQMVASRPGVLESLGVTEGRWVEIGDHLFTVIDPSGLRFRAEALQADLRRLTNGLPVTIVPQGGVRNNTEAVKAELRLSPRAHSADRTVGLYATPESVPQWARPGIAGYLEVTLQPDATKYLAIPSASIVRDGVELIFFRRLPEHPDYVERVVADTGDSDGRWTEVFNDLSEGDSVVVDGVYQLLNATSSQAEEGGHFHSDGTFHEGEDH